MKNTPTISILMPVYNGETYLAKAIESILAQTIEFQEFIIVDDGSQDASRKIVRKYALGDGRLRLIEKENSGIVDALNTGLSAARGDVIARMDADDIALPDRLEKQISYLLKHSDCLAVGSNVLYIDDADLPFYVSDLPTTHEEIEEGLLLGRGEYIRHPTALFPTAAVREVGGYRKQAEWAEDLDLYLRLAEKGRLANVPDVLLHYRIHMMSVNFSRFDAQRKAVEFVLNDTATRRSLEGSLAPSIAMPTTQVSDWHASWSVKALLSGNPSTARKHAVIAWKAGPFRVKSWAAVGFFLLGPSIGSNLYRFFKGG